MKHFIFSLFLVLLLCWGAVTTEDAVINEDADTTEETVTTEEPRSVTTKIQFGDPFVMLYEGVYYAYGTASADGIAVYTSTDLLTWQVAPQRRLALDKKDVWGNRWFWAPEVYYVRGKFYMYYSCDEHICVATSDSPLGPFSQQKQQPMLDSEKCIDNTLFIDDDGTPYLFFCRFNDGLNIWVAELEDNLLDLKMGTLHKCINVSQPWEEIWPRVNEGAFVVKRNGIYYMTYSANSYESPFYGIGVATATNIKGPWMKYKKNPIYQKVGELVGIGHSAMFTDKEGQLRITFHSHQSQKDIHPRIMHISKVSFKQENGNEIMTVDSAYITPTLDINPSKTFTNPLWQGADPWIIKHGGVYYTCRTARSGIEVTSSRFLTRIEERRIVWRTPREGWNSSNVWAPELHHIDGKWYIYYAAASKPGQPFILQRTGVLESDTPLGDYRDMGQLYTGDDPEQRDENIWAIDMTIFKHKERLYAVWSGWEQNRTTDATDQLLYIAHMPTPTSIGKRVLLSKPVEPWEKGDNIALLEGPAVIQHDGSVFILYSTRGSWTIHYKMGQLRLRSADSDPLDPQSWIKTGPVFQGNTSVFGVGHASFTTSPDDSEWWIYYHTKVDTAPGWNRAVCLQRFTFDTYGNPSFGVAVSQQTPINRPSGEN